MIAITTKFNMNFPKFQFQEDLRVVANRIIIPIIAENIDNQVSLNESPLPPNSLKYTAYKRKKGLSDQILIATGKLRTSFFSKDKGKNSVIITLKNERKRIGGYLEDMGKHFFGISTRMEESAMNYMNKRVKESIDDARGK
jgi:hypothetical protein